MTAKEIPESKRRRRTPAQGGFWGRPDTPRNLAIYSVAEPPPPSSAVAGSHWPQLQPNCDSRLWSSRRRRFAGAESRTTTTVAWWWRRRHSDPWRRPPGGTAETPTPTSSGSSLPAWTGDWSRRRKTSRRQLHRRRWWPEGGGSSRTGPSHLWRKLYPSLSLSLGFRFLSLKLRGRRSENGKSFEESLFTSIWFDLICRWIFLFF